MAEALGWTLRVVDVLEKLLGSLDMCHMLAQRSITLLLMMINSCSYNY